MKTNRSWAAAIAGLALLAILVPAAVYSQTAPAPPAPRGPAWAQGGENAPRAFFRQTMIEKLGLSEEQQSTFAELRLKNQQEQIRLRGELANAKAELKALLLDPEANRSAVLRAGDKIEQLRAQKAKVRLSHQMDVRELLTKEQRAQWVQMRGDHQRHGGWGGRGGGHHMCDRAPRMHQRGPRADG
ncbi:MAG TPA: periplasmic heavy metal sensor [Candidatus Krumholzibacteria bacterium]|nr:periplasmic heavy metal sensor [Candidatus Krumholzibacteria bacterium]